MAHTVTLFAWTAPAFTAGSPVDHTWVTTYDNRATPYANDGQVIAAGKFNWYCWGSFHPAGGTPSNASGYLGQQSGDLALASCLVAPNQDSRIVAAARGTIFVYGVDGVCHQLSNQVLYATGAGGRPLTVAGARGYMASTFIYGTYGYQHAAWASNIASCSGTLLTTASAKGFSPMSNPPDDFEERARAVLEPKALSELLALRSDVRSFSAQRWPGVAQPSAEALNARNQHMLDEAARLLGPDKFKEVFGVQPGEKIDLVDPAVSGSSGDIPVKPN